MIIPDYAMHHEIWKNGEPITRLSRMELVKLVAQMAKAPNVTHVYFVNSKQPSMFPPAVKPKRKVMMVVTDAGQNDGAMRYTVSLECTKCGHKDGWHSFHTKKECFKEPCPKCNQVESKTDAK